MNNLNAFTQGYITGLYPKVIWYNIKQFFYNLKYCYQRITKGYCDADHWDPTYHDKVLIGMIEEKIKNEDGYPDKHFYRKDGFKSYEDWIAFLEKLVDDLKDGCIYTEDLPEVKAAWDKVMETKDEEEHEKALDEYGAIYREYDKKQSDLRMSCYRRIDKWRGFIFW